MPKSVVELTPAGPHAVPARRGGNQSSAVAHHAGWSLAVKALFDSKLARTFADENDDDQDPEFPFVVPRGKPILDANGIGHAYIRDVFGQWPTRIIEKSCGNTDTKDVAAEVATPVTQGATCGMSSPRALAFPVPVSPFRGGCPVQRRLADCGKASVSTEGGNVTSNALMSRHALPPYQRGGPAVQSIASHFN
jgi:hypothetical protein